MMRRSFSRMAGGLAIIGAAAFAPLTANSGPAMMHASADFSSSVSLYKGAPVRILGVTVGHVSGLKVSGNHVHVDIRYERRYPLPADVRAVIVPPSVAGDRFVQLAPVYRSGPKLADHANIGLDRTAVPHELDETYQALDELAKSIGPNGANRDGALSDLLKATDHALAGNAGKLNSTLKQSASMLDTIAGHSDDITATISALNAITKTLAADDPQIRSLATSLGTVGESLNGQRDDISQATSTLNAALHDLSGFLEVNRKPLTDSLAGAVRTTSALTKRSNELAQMLDLAPVGLTDLHNVGQPQNFDPAQASDVPWQNRAYAVTSRANLFTGLANQLGYALNGICLSLPIGQVPNLSNLCGALKSTGGNLGGVLSNLLASQGGASASAPALTLTQLLGGGVK